MKIKLMIVFVLGFFCTPLVLSQMHREGSSPHAEALQLVLSTQQEAIKSVEQDLWWFDVDERQWTVKRPFGPGVLDSTHLFNVTYAIAGKTVAQWSVDTRVKQVTVTPQK